MAGGIGGRRRRGRSSSSPAGSLSMHLQQVSVGAQEPDTDDPAAAAAQLSAASDADEGCILSQDFFCTPDYITPDAPQMTNGFGTNKAEVALCPMSPEKSTKARSKRYKLGSSPKNLTSANFCDYQQLIDIKLDLMDASEFGKVRAHEANKQKKSNFVSKSAVALRCRVMPPPCIKNPYTRAISSGDDEILYAKQSKLTALQFMNYEQTAGEGLSRYRTDFHEIEQIGCGNFSRVYKVLKRIDGCMYAVKQSLKKLNSEMERARALMEVQALAALGSHQNVVGYYNSWFENEQLFIQMELCDCSLSMRRSSSLKCEEILQMLYQIAKALDFIHQRGIAHLDVKPENIYIKNGMHKLGDFGCATLLDGSLGIEEGDSRYMPQEMLNDVYEHLDKVDIFSLGAAAYELIKGSPLPDSGPQFSSLREGRMPLLPGYPMQLQSLLKSMMNPDPLRRPSAKDVMDNPLFLRNNAISL